MVLCGVASYDCRMCRIIQGKFLEAGMSIHLDQICEPENVLYHIVILLKILIIETLLYKIEKYKHILTELAILMT